MATGQEIISYCSSCKLDLKHVIVAHKSGNSGPVAKVRCNTCMKIHAFRTNPGTRAASVKKKESAPREKATIIPIEVEWMEQMRIAENKASQTYAPSKEFKQGDVIDHPTFGAGVVKTVKDGNKFEIIFQKDVKTLIHKLKEA